MSEKLLRDIHRTYLNCKEVFKPSLELADQVIEIEDEEERDFYEILFNFFLQQKQKEIIDKGVY